MPSFEGYKFYIIYMDTSKYPTWKYIHENAISLALLANIQFQSSQILMKLAIASTRK